MKKVLLINNSRRIHEIVALLDKDVIEKASSLRDILRLRGKSGEFGAVIVDTFGRFGLLALAASIILRLPLVCRLRGEFFREERERLMARRGFLRFSRYLLNAFIGGLCLNRAQRIIVNSQHIKKAMGSHIKGNKTFLVHNPCFPAKNIGKGHRDLPNGRLNILTITNMNLSSKVAPLIEAIDEWLSPDFFDEIDCYWVICGHGYHFERIKKLVSRKGLEARILLAGWQREIGIYLEWCHVMAHLTKIDAFPNSTMEAMILGKPVITNAESCGTLEQVFDGVNGFVVKDQDSFRASIRSYALDPAIRTYHGNAGRKIVEKMFSIESQRKEMKKALAGLI